MAAITASMVGELRAKTDAPMMECKKALTEADGDMDKAEELLRVKLGNKASKAASRDHRRRRGRGVRRRRRPARSSKSTAKPTSSPRTTTSWRSRKPLAELVAENNPADVAALAALPLSQDGFGPTVEDVRKGLVGKIGENMSIRRFQRYRRRRQARAAYLHGTRIGVLVEFEGDDDGGQGRGDARRGDEAGGAVVGRRAGGR